MGNTRWSEEGRSFQEKQSCNSSSLLNTDRKAQPCGGSLLNAADRQSEIGVFHAGMSLRKSGNAVSLRAEDGTPDTIMDGCESPEPISPTSVLGSLDWDGVPGLAPKQLSQLRTLARKGIVWQHPQYNIRKAYTLHYGGEVATDGHCLFSAVRHSLLSRGSLQVPMTALDIRMSAVQQFLEVYRECLSANVRAAVDTEIRNQYSPDLEMGWGVHAIQEVKLLARRSEREELDGAIQEMMSAGMCRELAAEVVYKERCMWVRDGESWASYMRTCGGPLDEFDIISLLYTEGGLLSIDENFSGSAAAFGDETALRSLANEYSCDIYVVQSHPEEDLFFLPHRPRLPELVKHPPLFLFMKGSDWCGGGGDHYEPILAQERPPGMEKPFCVL